MLCDIQRQEQLMEQQLTQPTDIRFQLGGHDLQAKFILVADNLKAEVFLHGRNFLRTLNVLVDLTAMWVTESDPKTPSIFQAIHDFSYVEVPAEKVIVGAKVFKQQPN